MSQCLSYLFLSGCTLSDLTTSNVWVQVGNAVPLGGIGKQTLSYLRKQPATVVR